MSIGRAAVFYRRDGAPTPIGCFGHVGWGFEDDQGRFVFGATENPLGDFHIAPGQDAGAWHQRGTLADAVAAMRSRRYDAYKYATFRDAAPSAAEMRMNFNEANGYDIQGNNCLDHTFKILEAYRQPDLQWPLTHGSPNEWFALYNGEFHNIASE